MPKQKAKNGSETAVDHLRSMGEMTLILQKGTGSVTNIFLKKKEDRKWT